MSEMDETLQSLDEGLAELDLVLEIGDPAAISLSALETLRDTLVDVRILLADEEGDFSPEQVEAEQERDALRGVVDTIRRLFGIPFEVPNAELAEVLKNVVEEETELALVA